MKVETLKLGFFSKAYFFNMENKDLVIEKERQIVCVYATGKDNSPIYAAIPLCSPKYFKGQFFNIKTSDENKDIILISVAEIRIVIDYNKKVCSINNNAKVYGSDSWGQDCSTPWTEDFDQLFNT